MGVHVITRAGGLRLLAAACALTALDGVAGVPAPSSYGASIPPSAWSGAGCVNAWLPRNARVQLYGDAAAPRAFLVFDSGNASRLALLHESGDSATLEAIYGGGTIRATVSHTAAGVSVLALRQVALPDVAECRLDGELTLAPETGEPLSPRAPGDLADADAAVAAARDLQERAHFDEAHLRADRAQALRRGAWTAPSFSFLLARLQAAGIELDNWHFDGAMAHLREARDMAAGLAPSAELAATLDVAEARALILGARYYDAVRIATQARSSLESLLGSDHLLTILALEGEGSARGLSGATVAGEALVRDALSRATRVLGEHHRITLECKLEHTARLRSAGRQAQTKQETDELLLALAQYRPADDALRWVTHLQESRNAVFVGDVATARTLAQRSLEQAEQLLGPDHPYVEWSLVRLAETYENVGQWEQALKLTRRAYEFERVRFGPAHDFTLSTQLQVALCLVNLGRAGEALPVMEDALQLAQAHYQPPHGALVQALALEAEVLHAQGRDAEAAVRQEAAYRQAVALVGEDHLVVKSMLHLLARNQLAAGQTEQALATLQEWLRQYEHWRETQVLAQEDRQKIGAGGLPDDYRLLVSLYARTHRVAEALHVAELTKGRSLLESLTAQYALRNGELPPSEVSRLRELDARAGELNREAQEIVDDPARRAQTVAARNHLLWQAQTLHASLRERYPRYAVMSHPSVADMPAMQKALSEDAVAMSYLVAESRLLAFVVRRHGPPLLRDLGPATDLDPLVSAYRDALGEAGDQALAALPLWRTREGTVVRGVVAPAPGALMLAQREQVESLLSERLLAPLADLLRDKRRWVVAPDGPLAFVAFDALPWHGRRVFDSHLVSQIQSLSVYALLQQRARARHAGTLDLIAMGAPDYLHVSPRRASDAQWPALAGAEREVRQVAALFAPARSRVALHGQASEASLQELEREGTLAHARRLLFATHAFVDAAEPMRSAVVLSRARDDANDGYVTAAKWTGYHLRSDLIVLSACDTASGGLLRGEGVMGLPFALLVAGNRDALLTLARVDDEAAAAFVPAFFRHVRAGADNALALALTKREFHRHARYRDPRYWAPFVLYGG